MLSVEQLTDYIDNYGSLFKVYRHDNSRKALQYISGLFHDGKHNIERMSERIKDSDYQQLQHFISESKWDHTIVLEAVTKDISDLFSDRGNGKIPTGLIIDESGHKKSGKHSVGVARQYLGSIGKVDNGQVGVFVALCQEDDVCLTDSRLYLPETWIKDTSRCKKAGVPKEAQKYKTKPELALDMIESFGGRVNYEWVGGDSIYGNSPKLREGLQALDKLYVMDVSENFLCYSQHPTPYVPGSKSMGRKKSSYISDFSPLKAKGLFAQIPPGDWKPLTVRTGTKGPLKRKVVVKPIFSWSAKRPTTEKVEKLRLVISCNEDGSEVKYSITNDCGLSRGSLLSDCGLLYRQMQRYWVERGFQDCKDVLGMTEYQVRGWRAWHHHITLTIMAYHFMVSQKVMHQQKIPLMSCADIKFFMALTLPKKADNPEKLWELINTRHRDRQKDIDRYLSP